MSVDLDILFPNGMTFASQMYIWDGSKPIKWDGSVTVVIGPGGTVTADQGVAGSDPWPVKFNTPQAVTGPLTDTQLRATPVPISGTVTVDTSLLATAAKQDTGNTSLASIKTNTDPFVAAAAGGYVRQDSNATIAKESGGNLATIVSRLPTALGAGGGLKVDGSGTALPVSVASLPLPSGAATEATLSTRLSESDFDTKIGSLTETAPTTDTASSGLNGRLQRIAQRLTSLITAIGSPFQAGGSIGNTTFASTIADGADVTLGTKTDAKNSNTDGTSVSVVSILKQISFSIQALVTGVVLAAGSAIIGKVGIDQTTLGTTNGVTPVPDTTNGWSVAMMTSADGSTALTNSAQAIKASAGKLGGYYIYNPNTSAIYVLLYNVAAASVTVGTTNPLMCFCIPASSAANLELVMGIPFSNAGWSTAATTTGGGNTAPSTALEAMFWYK